MATNVEVNLKVLNFRKEYLFAKLQKVYDLSQQLNKNNQQEFLSQFAELENVKIKFEEIILEIMQIELLAKPTAKMSTKELDAFDSLYSACRVIAVPLQSKLNSSSNSNKDEVRPSLPSLKLFEFDGQLENWTTFYDTFLSLVHNRNFENIDKFHYLLSCVRGPALNIIKKYPITSNNYLLAWKSLTDKYQDNRILINRYFDNILNFTPLTKSSVSNLNSFIETFDNSWKAIEALKLKDLGDYLMCHLALRALDNTTRKLFEESRDPTSLPSFVEVINFVNKQVKVLEHTYLSSSTECRAPALKYNQAGNYSRYRKTYVNKQLGTPAQNALLSSNAHCNDIQNNVKSNKTSNNSKMCCVFCKENHLIYRCEQFRKLSTVDRINRVNQLKLCPNCLKDDHKLSECRSTVNCGVCNSKHHYLLHKDNNASAVSSCLLPSNSNPQTLLSSRSVSEKDTCAHTTDKDSHSVGGVVLATARIHILDAFGSNQECRAVLDSGAQSSFITLECAQRLGLPRQHCTFSITGLGDKPIKNYGIISCMFKSRYENKPYYNANLVVVSKVASDMPNISFPPAVVEEYKQFKLADPFYYKRSRVDILIGNDLVSELIKDKPIKIKENIPQVIETILGFIVSGKLMTSACEKQSSHLSINNEQPLDDILRKFWEIEELPCKPFIDPLDQLAEELYVTHHTRSSSGRYVVPLIFKPGNHNLGNSKSMAERRLLYTERKLARTPQLQIAYNDFMTEYLELNHMEPYTGNTPAQYVIPHHGVVRPSSSSTPLRVVFDASAKTTNNLSLNDILLTGPKLYRDILIIILNFRLFECCLVSDVCKMYRGILHRKKDREYLHILYRESVDQPIQEFELKTVTYGLSCSPFLAIRTLHQLANDEGDKYPLAAQVIREGIYMDDVMYSCENLESACQLQDELIAIFKCAGFELKKWASNNSELLQRIPAEQRECPINFLKDDSEFTIKVLGLRWSPSSDTFNYVINVTDNVNTKRSILKLLASIYDPVGFLAPCLFVAKEILQDLWKLGIGWDEPLPPHMCQRWSAFITDLPCLSVINIERHMLCSNTFECELVGFCDASNRGYAACLYIISTSYGKKKVRLVTAKSKVAPIKTLTIPRLELMAALLLSKLIDYVRGNLSRIKIKHITALTDSTIVISWLYTETYKLKTFVSNRVVQITELLSPNIWRHVRSENNVADICSRGASPSELVTRSSEWLYGPQWLHYDRAQWPVASYTRLDPAAQIEIKPDVSLQTFLTQKSKHDVNTEFETLFSKYSSFMKLQRVVAWCLRFRSNCKLTKENRMVSNLTTNELNAAHDTIIKIVQQSNFMEEIKLIKSNKLTQSLRKLSPFIDASDFLRVGGRLSQANLPYHSKHPLLLPKRSWITKLLIEYYHKLYLHAGPRTLQGILCKKYWIVNARSIIRSILSKCLKCFKCDPTSRQPVMGTLPTPRVMPNKVFSHVGCDLGGPFFIKESLLRNAKVRKCYMCLFVCLSTKAVHIEVLSDLSCDCFLATLDRFVARRGLCAQLYSDCGTNFIAAAKHLKDVCKFFRDNSDLIYTGCTTRQIDWKFNCPASPAMGGLWEAGIKSAKKHLYRVIGDRSLTFEELTTVFCKIEAILNSRPLCPLSSDPSEFEALTAGHFLIGQNLLAVPEYNLDMSINISRLSRWQAVQQISQAFWKRWSDDYLHTLQQRTKWFKSCSNLKVGDLVIIRVDNCKPLQWPLGRVERLHPGPDHIVRVVTLRTKTGSLKRPVNKVCPLPYTY